MPVRCAFVIATVVASVLVLLAPIGQVADADGKVPIPGIGATCAACHAEATAEWATSIHRRTVSAPHISAERQGCAACHPTASDHLADPLDESKRPSLAGIAGPQASEMCLSCHRGGQQTLWVMSPHATIQDSCLACHDPHGGVGTSMLTAREPELCQECHPAQVAEGAMPSHHPIAEGKMVCIDCHNVHGEERGALPAASTADMCYRCHAEKEGPFLHEHPPVTEDCFTCHKAHGAQNDNLLIQDEPLLCLQCHPGHSDSRRGFLVPFDPANPDDVAHAQLATTAFYDRCTSCHFRIHGTDLDSGSGNGTFMPGLPLTEYPDGASSAATVSASSVDRSMWGFAEIEYADLDEDDSSNYVREYDGRNYDVPAPRIGLTEFGEDEDFRFEVTDLARGDQDIRLRFGNPNYDVQVSQSGLTHRLGRYNEPIDGEGLIEFPGREGGLEDVEATDLTGGKDDFHLDRTALEVRLAARCPTLPSVKWMLNFWQEAETGSQQFLFLDRCNACHKHQTSEHIDRTTSVLEGGAEVSFGSGVVRYMRQSREFENKAPEETFDFSGVASIGSGPAPLFGVPSAETDVDDLRVSGQVNEKVSAALLWRDKTVDNRLSGVDIDITSGGGGLSWVLSPDLRLGASFMAHSSDVMDIIHGGLSRDWDTSKINARYTGFRGSTLSVGYTNERVDRDPLGDVETVPRDSDSDIWRASLISRLGPKTRLQLRYRTTNTDHGEFFDPAAPPDSFPSRLVGLPSDARMFSGVLTYSLSSRTLLSGLYTDRDDSYDVSVPALAVAGTSDDERRTSGLQVGHNASSRTRVSAAYYWQDGATRSDVTYGTADFTLSPPLSPVDIVFAPIDSIGTFDYDAAIGVIDASFQATSRVRLFGRYATTETDGEQVAYSLGDYWDQDPDFDGVDVIFSPFDIEIVDGWIGVGYLVDPRTEVTLSYQRRSWDNAADPAQDGEYSVWRVGVHGEF